jgi:protein-disulfide isomerase
MIVRALATALLGGALLVGAAAIDWAARVSETPSGTFVRGNPDAPVKLVEYASYTCDHCARFSADAAVPLTEKVARGGVSVEFRHAVRDPLDLAAALLARCAGPRRFFAASDAIFAAQDDLLAKARAMPAPAGDDVRQVVTAYARGTGLLPIVARHGVTAARAEQCLADPAAYDRLRAMAEEAWQTRRIPGTPHFLVNGTPVRENVWAALAPRLER